MSTPSTAAATSSDDQAVIVVLVAAPTDISSKLARTLIESRAAACVNTVKGVHSTYRWEGKVVEDTEDVLLAKTTRASYAELERVVLKNHPYALPEVLALDTAGGNKKYLDWVRENVG
jgi:periplasmic divalent cation tolerance protein